VETLTGRCHCGTLSFELDWPDPGAPIRARACGCTYCTRHRGTYTSHPRARLRARVADPALLSRYRFGTGTAEFHVCARCGGIPFCTSAIDGHLYAVVNVNTFVDVDPARLEVAGSDFDGEALDDRLARRARSWIADVEVVVERG